MRINHMCDDNCFSGSSTKNVRKINCFSCDISFNTKCIDIINKKVLNILLSDSNIVFLCTKCCDKIKCDEQRDKKTNQQPTENFRQSSLPSFEFPSKTNAQTTLKDEANVSKMKTAELNFCRKF